LTLLKQTSAAASETATIDQASDHSAQNKIQRSDFDLDIVEGTPTQDQIRSILDYVGPSNIGKVIKGANNEAEALKKFKQDGESFLRPVVSAFQVCCKTSPLTSASDSGLEQWQSRYVVPEEKSFIMLLTMSQSPAKASPRL